MEDVPSTFGIGQSLRGTQTETENDIVWRDVSAIKDPYYVPPLSSIESMDTPHPEVPSESIETDIVIRRQTRLSSLTRVVELHSDYLDELPLDRFDAYDRDLSVLYRRMSVRRREISDVSFRVDEIEHTQVAAQEVAQGLQDRLIHDLISVIVLHYVMILTVTSLEFDICLCDIFRDMAPRNTETANPETAMTQATIRKMVNDSVASALGIQAATLTRPLNRNKPIVRKRIIATRKCTCKGFTRYQPIYSKETLRKGLPKSLEKKVAPSETRTLRETMIVVRNLLEQEIKRGPVQGNTDHQQNFEDKGATLNDNHRKQQNFGPEVTRVYVAPPIGKGGYAGRQPLCNQCKLHHIGPCFAKCGKCRKIGHLNQDCRTPETRTYPGIMILNQHGGVGYYQDQCPCKPVESVYGKHIN
ncbi:reverse transcriptase domain-containing protein [Artemisia annua]|uniref:Reverse transcriptase domain-containing protein n=1 Tax=Artemisia annua TaxID=35608 RepID=A0A2U1MY25_ARTAN|nr:reverse transcriptase domain-containing protein [Artemisia annua]